MRRQGAVSVNLPLATGMFLSMTGNEADFKREVDKQRISGNLDSPEGTLDAIMQAAVCGDRIGWRNSSTRLIVLTTPMMASTWQGMASWLAYWSPMMRDVTWTTNCTARAITWTTHLLVKWLHS
ncbi:hypothetical protein J4Q44_G00200760 [Coregonus suidteri]|uniref:Integrin beta subunit VWA domain-containing protein n=1 Tax=Coregonus suidteri TaxID=861788 RepID=A0AAN8LQ68_9TELE